MELSVRTLPPSLLVHAGLLGALCLALSACGSIAAEPGADAGPTEDGSTPLDGAIADSATHDGSASDAAGNACTTDADCGGGDFVCAYRVADRCAAKGTCMYFPGCPDGAACGPMPEPACGCDGKPAAYLDGGGYTKRPVRGPNACGANDAQKCATETTCGDDELCVSGFCTTQCMDSNACGTGTCDHTQCYGPHGCNPPPPGQGCPPVCMGICRPGIGGVK